MLTGHRLGTAMLFISDEFTEMYTNFFNDVSLREPPAGVDGEFGGMFRTPAPTVGVSSAE